MTGSRSACSHFGIDFDYDVDEVVVSLHGELDALSLPAFGGVLRALAEQGTRSVTLDLSELRFCNVGGLRVMAELAARMNAIGHPVEIREPAILTRMLEISDLQSLFVIADDASRLGIPSPPLSHPVTECPAHVVRSSRPRVGSRPRLSTGT